MAISDSGRPAEGDAGQAAKEPRFRGELAQRVLDVVVAASALVLLLPVFGAAAFAIKVEGRGPIFYRCPRVGRLGRQFSMLKFRKMHVGATGAALTAANDDRFTRIGRFLARTKLDEVPQFWNVLTGTMSAVGPRPEDSSFVALQPDEYAQILRIKPGIMGLSQLAFAREIEILDPEDRVGDYVRRLMPQKIQLDQLYVARRTLLMDLRILLWTVVAVATKREVAVHRSTGRLNLRRRPLAYAEALHIERAVS